jgi:hypothetical protein
MCLTSLWEINLIKISNVIKTYIPQILLLLITAHCTVSLISARCTVSLISARCTASLITARCSVSLITAHYS